MILLNIKKGDGGGHFSAHCFFGPRKYPHLPIGLFLISFYNQLFNPKLILILKNSIINIYSFKYDIYVI